MDSNRELCGELLLPAHSFSRPRCRVARSDDTLDSDPPAALGDRDRAFARLEKAVEERSHCLTLLLVDPGVDPLRSDPRFDDLLPESDCRQDDAIDSVNDLKGAWSC
jgi:hypothetical protein